MEKVCEKVDMLLKQLDNNIEFFDKNAKYPTLSLGLRNLKNFVTKCARSVEEIKIFATEYDFNDETSGNGYHSFVDIFDSAVKKTTKVCQQLISSREKILFRADNYAKYKVRREKIRHR